MFHKVYQPPIRLPSGETYFAYCAWGDRDDMRRNHGSLAVQTSHGMVYCDLANDHRAQFTANIEENADSAIRAFLRRANAHNWRGDRRGTTLNLAVSANADDAHETDAGTFFSSSNTSVRCDASATASSRYNGGMRFTGGPPQGSTINSATVSIYIASTSNDDPLVNIHLEDVDSAADYSSTADVTSRTRTASSVLWSATGLGTGYKSSPDISTPTQAVVNRAGYGGVLNVLFCGSSSSSSSFSGRSHNDLNGTPPLLDIDYTAAPTGNPLLMTLHNHGCFL